MFRLSVPVHKDLLYTCDSQICNPICPHFSSLLWVLSILGKHEKVCAVIICYIDSLPYIRVYLLLVHTCCY